MSTLVLKTLRDIESGTEIDIDDIYNSSNTKIIRSNLLVNVPSDFSTINLAMNYLRGFIIQSGVTVQIKVADGSYVITEAINLNHPQGSQIKLTGNESTPSLCVFKPANLPVSDAFQVTNGNVFGYLNGFRVDCNTKAPLANNFTAFVATGGARLYCGPKIESNNWYYGVAARDGSYVLADYAKVTNAGDVGIWAFCGSTILANYASSNSASDTVNGWGFGFQAEYGSTLVATGATATNNNIAGFAALSNSTCRVLSSTSSGNVGSGYLSRDGGQIECHNSTANNNARYAQEIITSYGQIVGVNFTASGNILGLINNTAYIGSESDQAKLSSTNGPLRIDGQPVYLNTSSGLQVVINDHANPTSAVSLSGGSSVVYISPQGSDSNADVSVAGKGSGRVQLGAYLSTGIPTVTGFIEIKDYQGRVLEVPVRLRT
ncbi:MAG TPA: hypothetical protein DEO73_17265 [Pantoea sp.]|nr:hypothetical protein [Pantoea sp.]